MHAILRITIPQMLINTFVSFLRMVDVSDTLVKNQSQDGQVSCLTLSIGPLKSSPQVSKRMFMVCLHGIKQQDPWFLIIGVL